MIKKIAILSFFGFLLASCTSSKTILEVTTFKIKEGEKKEVFNKLDAEIQTDFTSKQPGFIKRESGINEKGEYLVVVYWENLEDAAASMNKFMKDSSVGTYASMIKGSSMKMNRYTINKKWNAKGNQFTEVMSFNLNKGVDISTFNTINKKVEIDVTAKRKGFLQRITGVDENGKQVVIIYWDNKENSDAALNPFMSNDLAKKFMSNMKSTTVEMGRYQSLLAK